MGDFESTNRSPWTRDELKLKAPKVMTMASTTISKPATRLRYGLLRLSIKDPESPSKTWTLDVAPSTTVAAVTKLFLTKKHGSPHHGCQIVLSFGKTILVNHLLEPIGKFLSMSENIVLQARWKPTAMGCSGNDCEICDLVSDAPLTDHMDVTTVPAIPAPVACYPSLPPQGLLRSSTQPAGNRSDDLANSRDDSETASAHKILSNLGSSAKPSGIIQQVGDLLDSVLKRTDMVSRLERLIEMKKEGYLSSAEFDKAKSRILEKQ